MPDHIDPETVPPAAVPTAPKLRKRPPKSGLGPGRPKQVATPPKVPSLPIPLPRFQALPLTTRIFATKRATTANGKFAFDASNTRWRALKLIVDTPGISFAQILRKGATGRQVMAYLVEHYVRFDPDIFTLAALPKPAKPKRVGQSAQRRGLVAYERGVAALMGAAKELHGIAEQIRTETLKVTKQPGKRVRKPAPPLVRVGVQGRPRLATPMKPRPKAQRGIPEPVVVVVKRQRKPKAAGVASTATPPYVTQAMANRIVNAVTPPPPPRRRGRPPRRVASE